MPHFPPEALAAWTGGRWTRLPARAPSGVRHETASVRPGDLFVALRGERRDGHEFVREAFGRGAAAAVVGEGFAAAHADAGPLLMVGDTRRALAALAAGHRARCVARIVGVTGSLGKTTVKEMIAAILAADGPTACTRGNWNNDLGLPLSLLEMDPADRHGVFEIGMNHPGELAPLCALLRPDWGVMTRIGPVHLEFFADEAAIADEKATLVRALPPGGLAVLAADEPWFERVAAAARCRVVTVALAPADADYAGRAGPGGGLVVRERSGAESFHPLPGPGAAVLRNALRAVAVGREAGIPAERIARALAGFRLPPMRGGEVDVAGVRWFNDAYNASPLSLEEAVATFAASVPGRRWLALGGMLELGATGPELHRRAGRALAAHRWEGLVVKGPLAAGMADGAREAGFPADRIHRADDARGAAEALAAAGLAPGDAILIKGSRGERMEDVMAEWARRQGVEPPEAAH